MKLKKSTILNVRFFSFNKFNFTRLQPSNTDRFDVAFVAKAII